MIEIDSLKDNCRFLDPAEGRSLIKFHEDGEEKMGIIVGQGVLLLLVGGSDGNFRAELEKNRVCTGCPVRLGCSPTTREYIQYESYSTPMIVPNIKEE